MKHPTFQFNKNDETESAQLNHTINDIYQYKHERIRHTNSASTQVLVTKQETESGYFVSTVTTTGTNTTIAFHQKYNTITSVNLTKRGSDLKLFVSDITACQMTININVSDSDVTARFYWQVTGTLS